MIARRILFVVLSPNWSSSERTLVSYARALVKRGHQISFYTQRDSYVDLSVKELAKEGHENCKIFYHLGSVSVSFLRWGLYRHARRVVMANEIDLIVYHSPSHFYPISFLLRRSLHISQFIYQNSVLSQSFRSFWLAPIKRRLDMLITSGQEAIGNIKGALGISERKIKVIGLCFDEKELATSDNMVWESDSLIIGTVFSPTKKNVSNLKPVLKAISILRKMENLAGVNVKLRIFTQRKWENFILTNELKELLKKEGLEEHVELINGTLGLNSKEEAQSLHSFIKSVNLCVGLDEAEYMEDWPILGLLLGKPFLTTRKASAKEFLRKAGAVGDTYRAGDVREIKDKILKLYSSKEAISYNLESLAKTLRPLNDAFNTARALEERFEISLVRRRRISIRRGLLGNG